MEYLFCSENLYPHEDYRDALALKEGFINVKPDTLLCYDVATESKKTWTFKVYGYGDIRFKTHYDWALVEYTPENVEVFKRWREKQMFVNSEQKEAERLHTLIAVAPPLQEVNP